MADVRAYSSIWIGFLAAALLTGCGYHRTPYGGGSAADFLITVAPASSTVAAGAAVPAETITVTRLHGFAGTVTVTVGTPAPISCVSQPCSLTLGPAASSGVLRFTTLASAPAGSATITFLGISGALSHQAQAQVAITVAVTPIAPTPPSGPPVTPPAISEACAAPVSPSSPAYSSSGFIALNNPDAATGLVYDKAHNQIFASNIRLNAIDILSPEAMTVVARLPMPRPMALDLSADGTELIAGTQTHYFYRVATATRCVVDREYLPVLPPYLFDLSPMYPAALADGSVLFSAHDVASDASGVFRWIPGAGFVEPQGLGALRLSSRAPRASGDRQHVFLAEDSSGGTYGRFDLSTGAVTTAQVGSGAQRAVYSVYAVNGDGSRALVKSDCCSLEVIDSNFQPVAEQSNYLIADAVLAAPDFSRFYVQDLRESFARVLDGSLQPAGILPFTLADDYGDYGFAGMDGSNRLLLTTPWGLFLVDTRTLTPVPPATSTFAVIRVGVGDNAAMTPNTPENGHATTLNGGNFNGPASVSFLAGPSKVAVPGAVTTSVNTISLTTPAGLSGCFDVEAEFSGTFDALAPLAYCYSPEVDTVDGDAGPEAGGATLTLYGRGFGNNPVVLVGGAAATQVAVSDIYAFPVPYLQSKLTAVVPPGRQGSADVVVSSGSGSLLLKGAYTYAQRQDTPLPPGARPSQMLVDGPRGRVLIADAGNNQLLVYALGGGSLLRQVSTGPGPQAMALTPDGTRLLVGTSGDNRVSVLDGDSYATLEQAALPGAVAGLGVPGPLLHLIAFAGDKALVETKAGYLTGPANYTNSYFFDYDLRANAVSVDPLSGNNPTDENLPLAASGDGAYALVGPRLLQVSSGTYLLPDTAVGVGQNAALNADGSLGALDAVIIDNQARWQTALSAPPPIAVPPLEEALYGGAVLNASGSLLYREAAGHVRLYDTTHGMLARTVEVPDGLVGSASAGLLGLDPAGQRFAAVTAAGLSMFSFASDPLTISRAVVAAGGGIEVDGSGFEPGAALLVDQLAMTAVTVVSTSRLLGTLPVLGAGSHAVTVQNPDGSSYTLTLAFETQ